LAAFSGVTSGKLKGFRVLSWRQSNSSSWRREG